MQILDLNSVFFRLQIEDAFLVKGRAYVVTGRVVKGEIHDKALVIITDDRGRTLRRTRVLDLDWFDRYRCGEHVTADAGMNIGVRFEICEQDVLQSGNYLVIETPADLCL